MNMKTIAKTIGSTTVFTLAPAFSILLGVVTLSGFLGLPLPWIRLSVIGAITYELPAATSTANALGISLSEMISDPKVYTAIAWVMTLGILPSIILTPILIKKVQNGIVKSVNYDYFDNEIIDALRLLIHDESVPYMEYVGEIKKNKIATKVKLADLRHNSDITRLDVIDEKALHRREKYLKAIALLEE